MKAPRCDDVVKNKLLCLRGLYVKALNGEGTQGDLQEFCADLEAIHDCYECVSSRVQCPLSRLSKWLRRFWKHERNPTTK